MRKFLPSLYCSVMNRYAFYFSFDFCMLWLFIDLFFFWLVVWKCVFCLRNYSFFFFSNIWFCLSKYFMAYFSCLPLFWGFALQNIFCHWNQRTPSELITFFLLYNALFIGVFWKRVKFCYDIVGRDVCIIVLLTLMKFAWNADIICFILHFSF